MDYLHLTLSTPEENLALEEALLDGAEDDAAQANVLRVWESTSHFVVLGSGCRFEEDVREEACRADGVPILRRASGGGTVLLGPGCLNFSVVLAQERALALETIGGAFAFVLARVCAALGQIGLDVERRGISDLVFQGRKVSGSGQRRRRRNVLVHGTLLYGFDVALIERYLPLPIPKRRPPYRRDRSHREFVGNLPVDPKALHSALRAAWNADLVRAAWPVYQIGCLVREKYTSRKWLYRR